MLGGFYTVVFTKKVLLFFCWFMACHCSIIHVCYNILTEIVPVTCMGFGSWGVWSIGFRGCMGYGLGFPAYQVGNKKNLWDIREYGLSELWVKRESTVPVSLSSINTDINLYDFIEILKYLIMYLVQKKWPTVFFRNPDSP